MSEYEITDDMLGRHHVTEGDIKRFPEEFSNYVSVESDEDGDTSVREKFDSVGAFLAFTWTMDSSQDEDAGNAQYGNGWNALFRSERLILNESNSGFVTAYRIESGRDVDEVWAEIEKGAVYPDQCNNPDCEDLSCENFDCGQEV